MFTGFLSYIQMGIGALAMFAVLYLYDGLVDDPAVRRDALNGYVLRSERDAIASQLAEEERRRNRTAQALEEHRKRLSAAVRAEEEASERLEAEIIQNEKLLEDAGRACRLDDADVRWLLRKPR